MSYYVDEKRYFICFQIKSFRDLEEKDPLRKLKGQHFDSQKRFDFEDYYIILATDEKEHMKRISIIKSEFSSHQNVTIIDPSQFLFLLRLKSPQIGAIVKSFANEGDLLIQKSLDKVAGLIRTQYSLLFLILDVSFRKGFGTDVNIDGILNSEYLKNIYENFSFDELDEDQSDYLGYDPYKGKDFRQMIETDLDRLSEDYFEIDPEKRIIIPDYEYLKPIIGLILEAQIKYEFDSEETVEYLEQLIFDPNAP